MGRVGNEDLRGVREVCCGRLGQQCVLSGKVLVASDRSLLAFGEYLVMFDPPRDTARVSMFESWTHGPPVDVKTDDQATPARPTSLQPTSQK